MTHGSLFSGIGGFDLAAEWAGFVNKWQVEINPWCQRVLEKNFPEVKRYGDIRTTGKHNLERVDIISGGFPCQPFSVAGKQKGKEDDRYLWPEMLRVIREMQPAFVVGENVVGIVNMALDQVLTDLENEGYTCELFIIPACAVNAPHRRDRVWIIAHSDQIRCDLRELKGQGVQREDQTRDEANTSIASNATRRQLSGAEQARNIQPEEKETHTRSTRGSVLGRPRDWSDWPTQPGVCGRDDGIPHRVDRIKGLGNSIVPEVALEIFLAIKQIGGIE